MDTDTGISFGLNVSYSKIYHAGGKCPNLSEFSEPVFYYLFYYYFLLKPELPPFIEKCDVLIGGEVVASVVRKKKTEREIFV